MNRGTDASDTTRGGAVGTRGGLARLARNVVDSQRSIVSKGGIRRAVDGTEGGVLPCSASSTGGITNSSRRGGGGEQTRLRGVAAVAVVTVDSVFQGVDDHTNIIIYIHSTDCVDSDWNIVHGIVRYTDTDADSRRRNRRRKR